MGNRLALCLAAQTSTYELVSQSVFHIHARNTIQITKGLFIALSVQLGNGILVTKHVHMDHMEIIQSCRHHTLRLTVH